MKLKISTPFDPWKWPECQVFDVADLKIIEPVLAAAGGIPQLPVDTETAIGAQSVDSYARQFSQRMCDLAEIATRKAISQEEALPDITNDQRFAVIYLARPDLIVYPAPAMDAVKATFTLTTKRCQVVWNVKDQMWSVISEAPQNTGESTKELDEL